MGIVWSWLKRKSSTNGVSLGIQVKIFDLCISPKLKDFNIQGLSFLIHQLLGFLEYSRLKHDCVLWVYELCECGHCYYFVVCGMLLMSLNPGQHSMYTHKHYKQSSTYNFNRTCPLQLYVIVGHLSFFVVAFKPTLWLLSE